VIDPAAALRPTISPARMAVEASNTVCGDGRTIGMTIPQ
jgi:hypothetical protein